jgi:hypothetical protein
MADGLDPKSMAVTLLLISIFFHYFSYSFTVQAIDYTNFDISLDLNDLYASGIMLGEYDEHNITYDAGTWQEFDIENKTIRLQWKDWAFLTVEDIWDSDSGAGIALQEKNDFFGFDTWASFYIQGVNKGRLIRNATIIDNWETTKNYTKFLSKTSYVIFITDPLKLANISRAVTDDGIITVTIAKNMDWASENSLNTFVSWYIGLVTGSETWGLPASFSILVRVMTMLGIFSGIFLMAEARRLIKVF